MLVTVENGIHEMVVDVRVLRKNAMPENAEPCRGFMCEKWNRESAHLQGSHVPEMESWDSTPAAVPKMES